MLFFSYAKVNLFLSVVQRRADGYHDLISVFTEIALRDELRFYWGDGDLRESLSVHNKYFLIRNAYRVLYDAYAQDFCPRKSLSLSLKKRVPIGAGLGGGSSNAATTLLAVNSLYRLGLSQEQLFRLAAPLGSDVPFFVYGGYARASSTGSDLNFYQYGCVLPLVVVYPNLRIGTAQSYRSLSAYDDLSAQNTRCELLLKALESSDLPAVARYLYNSFEVVQFKRYPVLSALKQRLIHLGALGALMSGTGSSVFGVFPSHARAHQVSRILRRESKYKVFATSSILRTGLQSN